jgi:hypothetical protein
VAVEVLVAIAFVIGVVGSPFVMVCVVVFYFYLGYYFSPG